MRNRDDRLLDREEKLLACKDSLASVRRMMEMMRTNVFGSPFTVTQYAECLIEYSRLLGEFHRLMPFPRQSRTTGREQRARTK